MRASEFTILDETVEEQRWLNDFAGDAAKDLITDYNEGNSIPELRRHRMKRIYSIKSAQEDSLIPLMNGIYIWHTPAYKKALNNNDRPIPQSVQEIVDAGLYVNVVVFKNPNTKGQYDPSSFAIYINHKILSDPAEVASTFLHEFQHAIDDIKSRGSQKDQMGKALNINTNTGKDQWYDYISRNQEVNARYAEALRELINYIGSYTEGGYTSQELMTYINYFLEKYYMKQAFPNGINDPKYRRLVTRIYQYLAEYHKNLIQSTGQPAQKQSLAQKTFNNLKQLFKNLVKL